LAGDTFASGNAGLGATSENFFDGVESAVIDAFSEGEAEGVGGRNLVEGQHLKGFEDGKRNAARRMDGGGVEGSCDGASPLQSEGGGDFLFGGKARLFDPLSDFSVVGAALGFEGGADFGKVSLPRASVRSPRGMRLGGWGDGAITRRWESWLRRAVSRHWGWQ
jgi:hypothetical protein